MRSVCLILSIVLPLCVVGQQDPLLSHSLFNQMAINPAYAGSKGMICTSATYREQWMGFGEGRPVTSMVNLDAAISPFGLTSGLGVNIFQDKFGFNENIAVNLAYAFRFSLKSIGNLAIGINGGFINNTLDPTWNFPDVQGDALVPQAKQSDINIDLGAGIFFNSSEMFFGISAAHLNETKFHKNYTSQYKRTFYMVGGYYLKLPNQSWELNPTVLISSNLTVNQLSFGTNFIYNKRFWGGVSYRVGEAAIAMLGVELFSGMRVGYAYEFSTSELNTVNSGSHEFTLGYCFSLKKERPPQQYKSIRFL